MPSKTRRENSFGEKLRITVFPRPNFGGADQKRVALLRIIRPTLQKRDLSVVTKHRDEKKKRIVLVVIWALPPNRRIKRFGNLPQEDQK